jgi:integrase
MRVRVPLHQHLLTQGFLRFVEKREEGPLFYTSRRTTTAATEDPLKRKKPPAAQVRQRLAEWVRELGITDPELSPNHGWRHSFKAVGRRVGISDPILDVICGHAPASVGSGYGRAPLEDMAAAISKFPRYQSQREARMAKRADHSSNPQGARSPRRRRRH